ncbi:ABC transporter substrate-binding protein [Streptomyces sp. NPDC042898]|uniref:protein kinase domain-containing protein n=1 Tax=Streptomyces sp. NPDC042898 TaxID=3154334 RepID=UPI0033CC5985
MRGMVLDGRYELVERVGAGGMGVVWRAEDHRLGRHVAVKVLAAPEEKPEADRERLYALFHREARAAAVLESSYIVGIHDHGTAVGEDGRDIPYLVMPLLTGRTLAARLREEGPLAPGEVARVGAQICRALAIAHRAGVVHRDIKPANVFLTDENLVKVLDFGVATFVDAATQRLTRTGDGPNGTVLYMAPERFKDRPDDPRGDLYSLGCVLYELLTGSPPFMAGAAAALIHHHLHEPPPPIDRARPGLPDGWAELVTDLLAKDPAERPDAGMAIERLEALAGAGTGTGTGGVSAGTAAAAASVPEPVLDPVPAALPDPVRVPEPALDPVSVPDPALDPVPEPVSVPDPVLAPETSYRIAPPEAEAEQAEAENTAQPPSRRSFLSVVGAVVLGGGGMALGMLDEPTGYGRGGAGNTGSSVPYDTLLGTAADSRGPAPAPDGARRGGGVTILSSPLPDASGPGRLASGEGLAQLRQLVSRSLTGYKRTADGRLMLVGDLATAPGRTTDGGRTWTFTLKENVRYQDGTAVTSADFTRAFTLLDKDTSPDPLGVVFAATVRMVEAPDRRTVVYRLRRSDTGFPFLLAGPAGAPAPVATDPARDEATRPACGPYLIAWNQVSDGTQYPSLERNPQWDAASDPLRTAFPDGYRFEVSDAAGGSLAERIASSPAGRPVVVLDSETPGVPGAPDASAAPTLRYAEGSSTSVSLYVVNTRRVRDRSVRLALALAFPRQDVHRIAGDDRAVPATRLLPPGVRGHLDAGAGPLGTEENGDPERARRTLAKAGAPAHELVVGYTQGEPMGRERARAVVDALLRAGFRARAADVGAPLPGPSATRTGAYDYDLHLVTLSTYSPDPALFFRSFFDTRVPNGQGLGALADRGLHTAIDRASAATGDGAQAAAWAAVDELLVEYGAVVPICRHERRLPYRRGLEGLTLDGRGPSLATAYVSS